MIPTELVCHPDASLEIGEASGFNYGVSVGGRSPWPGADGARTVAVQYDLDWDRFITMFIERVARRPGY